MPKKHLRPEKDFTVTSLASERDIERRHREAGFPGVPDEIIVRRFWQFLRFIQHRGLTVRTVASSLADVSDNTTLRNSDLTDEGFYFIQRFHGRWLNRTRKDCGEPKEDAYLTRWYDQFLLQHEVA
jgi:hypothetical protein